MPAPMSVNDRGWPIPNANPEDLVPQIQDMEEAISADLTGSGVLVLSDDATAVSSNTLTAQAGLSRDVVSGIAYSFTIVLFLTATLMEGWKLDLDGGSAAMSWITGLARGYDGSSLALVVEITDLTTEISPQDGFSGTVEIKGSFVPSGDGTFIPRLAQVAHSSGSVQTLKGSSISVEASV